MNGGLNTVLYLGLLDDEDIELDSAALALSALDHEGIDIEPYLAQLRGLTDTAEAARERAEKSDLQSGEGQGALLAAVIGTHMGFAGDRDSYDAPLNADMIRVLDRRKGLPVSLSILYVAVARRMGWRADALNTPSHVLVSVGPANATALIDPFNGGALVGTNQYVALLNSAGNPGGQARLHDIAPMANRMILVRLLLNQARRAEQGGDTVRASVLYERMTVIAPDHGAAWWELARLHLTHGKVGDARASLSAMLEVTREAERRAQVSAMLDRLTRAE